MDFTRLSDNLKRVQGEIAKVQDTEGVAGDVRIVAVTKGHPLDAVRAAANAGFGVVGENRVQEALSKQDSAPELNVDWHLIGHLQTNKAKFVPGRFALVHSVDSLRIAQALSKAASGCAEPTKVNVLIQVNVSGEEQKSGCAPETAAEIASFVANAPNLEARGLMTMAPFVEDAGEQRRVFGSLRLLRDNVEKQGFDLPELSMGMSNDYLAAVAEGATILRLGTVLFGERGV